jgi:hypothetical protein
VIASSDSGVADVQAGTGSVFQGVDHGLDLTQFLATLLVVLDVTWLSITMYRYGVLYSRARDAEEKYWNCNAVLSRQLILLLL